MESLEYVKNEIIRNRWSLFKIYLTTQLTLTCSKSTIETPERHHWRRLITLNIFYTFFLSFYCWLWTSKCYLGVKKNHICWCLKKTCWLVHFHNQSVSLLQKETICARIKIKINSRKFYEFNHCLQVYFQRFFSQYNNLYTR